jgi:hypothetical protein
LYAFENINLIFSRLFKIVIVIMISKKKIYWALGVLLIGVGIGIFYIYDGFEIFSSEKEPDKVRRSDFAYSKYVNLFSTFSIPYSIELVNIELEKSKMKKLDTNFVLNFVEKRVNPDTKEDQFQLYEYFAVSKFYIYDNLMGIVVLKSPKNQKMIGNYIMKLYTKDGEQKSKFEIAQYYGDNKFMTIKEGKIFPGGLISIKEKGIVFSKNCDSISSVYTMGTSDYKFGADGYIEKYVPVNPLQ